jgi:glycosyltransferase involved in cell wall biosynthesis
MMRICIVTGEEMINRTFALRDREILQSLGFHVPILGINPVVPNPLILKNLRSILKMMRQCNIVIAWFAFPSTILLSKIIGMPVIANAVGHEVAYYPEILFGLPWNPAVRPLVRLAFMHSDEIIGISRESLRWAYRWSRKKGFIIHEGIDFENYDCNTIGGRSSSENPIILTISFLSLDNIIRKDILTIIKAIKEVKKKYPNVKLYIVGKKMDDYLFSLLNKITQRLDIESNVIFTGELPHKDLLKLICSADLFVMTSYQEGFPTVACEASVAGTPVIVSDRPAMNEVFTDDIAIIVEPGNPSKLANAIIDALENREETLRKARKAQAIIKHKYNIQVRKEKMKRFMLLFIRKLKNDVKSYYRYSIKHITIFLILLVAWWPLHVISRGVVFRSSIMKLKLKYLRNVISTFFTQ